MKTKILLPIFIILFATTAVNAQINEGRYLLGGSIRYSNTNNNPNTDQQDDLLRSQGFNTNIQFGKVIKDNAVAGIFLSYEYQHYNPPTEIKNNQYVAGVFYRKYKPLAKSFYFFGEADAFYNYMKGISGTFQIGSEGERFTSNIGGLSFAPGFSFSLCKRMQMELVMTNLVYVSYGVSKNEGTETGTSNISSGKINTFAGDISFNSNLLSNFRIGFKFLLGK